MSIRISKMLEEGLDSLIKAHDDAEGPKVGTLRGGSVGLYDAPTDTFTGKCPRQAYLRYKGIKYEIDSPEVRRSNQLLFEAGFANEDKWLEVIKASWKGKILQEEEFPIEWQVTPEVKGTGREDIILCDDKGNAVHMLELKQIASLWSARNILTNAPDLGQLTQAANYMFRTGIPVSMLYSLRAHMAVLGWAQKNFPKMGEEGSQYCEYNDKGEIKKVLPFFKVYNLLLDSDRNVKYVDEDTGNEYPTIINLERIDGYYEYVAKMGPENKMPPRPVTLMPDGKKGGFNPCDYCSLKPTCDKFEGGGLQIWESEVKKLVK